LKYPLYFAAQWVLRDPGTDVIGREDAQPQPRYRKEMETAN
jgi:hypothetical protein